MKRKKKKRRYYVVIEREGSREVKRLPKDAPNILSPVENWNSWAADQIEKL